MAAMAENPIGANDQFVHCQAAASPPPQAADAEKPEKETKYQRDVRELVDLLSNLNPSAKEFFPASRAAAAASSEGGPKSDSRLSADAPVFVASNDYYFGNGLIGFVGGNKDSSSDGSSNSLPNRRKKSGYNNGRRRMNDRGRKAEREESIRRTVYVSDIDQHVTEEKLAEIFATCGQVVDCRICGDPHSILRFAFIEFSDEDGARAALNLSGTMLGFYPVRVLPSKTAILPVNPKFLPRSEDEKEMVVRTVYCTNIDKKVTQQDVKLFFEQLCGEVSRLRLLGDNVHSTRIAFVEFVQRKGWQAKMVNNNETTVLNVLKQRLEVPCGGWTLTFSHAQVIRRYKRGRKCNYSLELQWHGFRFSSRQGESFKDTGEASCGASSFKLKL